MHHFTRVRADTTSLVVETFGVVGDGSPAQVIDSFRYEANGCGPPTPSLAFTPSSRSVSAPVGGAPVSTTTSLTSSGGVASFSVTDNQPWLSASPSDGGTPATLTITADPSGLSPGTYTGTVSATAAGFTAAAMQVTFAVQPVGGGSGLQVSLSPDRSAPASLTGALVSGSIYVFFPAATGITRVRFWIDDPTRSGPPDKLEKSAPYDLAGTATNGNAHPFNASSLGPGSHSVTAHVERNNGNNEVITSTFTVTS
jgi:hypothetical protein